MACDVGQYKNTANIRFQVLQITVVNSVCRLNNESWRRVGAASRQEMANRAVVLATHVSGFLPWGKDQDGRWNQSIHTLYSLRSLWQCSFWSEWVSLLTDVLAFSGPLSQFIYLIWWFIKCFNWKRDQWTVFSSFIILQVFFGLFLFLLFIFGYESFNERNTLLVLQNTPGSFWDSVFV